MNAHTANAPSSESLRESPESLREFVRHVALNVPADSSSRPWASMAANLVEEVEVLTRMVETLRAELEEADGRAAIADAAIQHVRALLDLPSHTTTCPVTPCRSDCPAGRRSRRTRTAAAHFLLPLS